MSQINKIVVSAAVIFGFASPAILHSVKKYQADNAPTDTVESRKLRNSSAFATILGEFRTNINDMLFIKTERYLHRGVAYDVHIDETVLAASGEAKEKADSSENLIDKNISNPLMQESVSIKPGTVQTHDHDDHNHDDHDHDHDHDHHAATSATTIPSKNEDYRGFIGELEREIKPWEDASTPHTHTAGTELLPWYRIATLANPHGVKNYMIGAWWLKSLKTDSQTAEALKFINEGITNNPDAYDLYLMRGYLYRQQNDHAKALDSFIESATVALKRRPSFGEITPTWDAMDEEQFTGALTMATSLIRDSKGTDEAIKFIQQYEKYFSAADAGLINRMKTAARNN